MRRLSQAQRDIFNFIKRSYEDRGFPPSIREIGTEFGMSSTNGVRYHLNVLSEAGLIVREKGTFRGIRMAEESNRDLREVGNLPVLGRVAAGQPILATEDIECEVKLDKTLFGLSDADEVFGLRIHGDSMKDVGIMNDDIAIVRRQEDARDGDIVVAMVEEEATVKRYRRHNGAVHLEPENSAYDPIILSGDNGHLSIIGKVVGVLGSRF